MKSLVVWLIKYLVKKFKIEVICEDMCLDITNSYVYKDKICIVIGNMRVINRE